MRDTRNWLYGARFGRGKRAHACSGQDHAKRAPVKGRAVVQGSRLSQNQSYYPSPTRIPPTSLSDESGSSADCISRSAAVNRFSASSSRFMLDRQCPMFSLSATLKQQPSASWRPQESGTP